MPSSIKVVGKERGPINGQKTTWVLQFETKRAPFEYQYVFCQTQNLLRQRGQTATSQPSGFGEETNQRPVPTGNLWNWRSFLPKERRMIIVYSYNWFSGVLWAQKKGWAKNDGARTRHFGDLGHLSASIIKMTYNDLSPSSYMAPSSFGQCWAEAIPAHNHRTHTCPNSIRLQ